MALRLLQKKKEKQLILFIEPAPTKTVAFGEGSGGS